MGGALIFSRRYPRGSRFIIIFHYHNRLFLCSDSRILELDENLAYNFFTVKFDYKIYVR